MSQLLFRNQSFMRTEIVPHIESKSFELATFFDRVVAIENCEIISQMKETKLGWEGIEDIYARNISLPVVFNHKIETVQNYFAIWVIFPNGDGDGVKFKKIIRGSEFPQEHQTVPVWEIRFADDQTTDIQALFDQAKALVSLGESRDLS